MISIQHLQLVEGLKLQPCLLKLLPSIRQLLDQSRRATLSKDFEPLNDDDDDDDGVMVTMLMMVTVVMTVMTMTIILMPAA